MPTAEQTALRRDSIVDHVNRLGSGDITVKQVPGKLLFPVLAGALEQGFITAADVPAKAAHDVALSFLKDTADRERDRAADVGTDIHDLIERVSNGEKLTVPPEATDHFISWTAFRLDYQMSFIETEFTVFSKSHYYAGTGDFIGRSELHPEWGLILGDYKTSESGIWPDIALQLAALRYADFIYREDGSEDRTVLSQVKTFVGVQITKTGYRVVPVRVSEGTFRVFLAATTVSRWKHDFEQLALGDSEFIEVGA